MWLFVLLVTDAIVWWILKYTVLSIDRTPIVSSKRIYIRYPILLQIKSGYLNRKSCFFFSVSRLRFDSGNRAQIISCQLSCFTKPKNHWKQMVTVLYLPRPVPFPGGLFRTSLRSQCSVMSCVTSRHDTICTQYHTKPSKQVKSDVDPR